MVDEPTVGTEPHERTDATPAKKATHCPRCDRRIAGYDARAGEPVCGHCAHYSIDAKDVATDVGEPDDDTTTRWFNGEPPAAAELNAFRRDLLAIIALYEPVDGHPRPYGLGIKATLENLYDRTVHDTQVYPALNDLVEAGFLRTDLRNQRTNYYEFTDRGRAALATHARFLMEAAIAANGHSRIFRSLSRPFHDSSGSAASRRSAANADGGTVIADGGDS